MARSKSIWGDRAKAVRAAASDRFTDLVQIGGLDPTRDLRLNDWSGCDFSACDLTGFDFTGARLHGCDFTGARIAGARFDQAEIGRVLHTPGRSPHLPAETTPIANLRDAADWAAFADPRKRFPSPLVGEGQGGGDTAASELPPTVQTTPTPNPSPQGGGGRERRAPSPNRPADDHLPIGAIFSDAAPGWAPEMVVVPPGTFWMGSKDGEGDKDERPRHEVTIGYRLAVGRTPVTFEEWDACFNNGGTKHKPETKWGRGRKPVHSVSWDDITKHYLPWLNRKLGLSGPSAYRLLTEAEWEYCCRAGTETAYSFGDTITEEQAQFLAKQTVEVGTFPSNAFGLHDMHGNLWEWCEDAWATDYTGAPADGSARTSADESISRVLRGGSWDDLPQDLRSAQRDVSRPGSRSSYLGFRLARTLSHSP